MLLWDTYSEVAGRMLEHKTQGAGYRLHDGKMLRRGYSTGTCAAAAAKAAALALLGQAPPEVAVRLPGGATLRRCCRWPGWSLRETERGPG